MGLEQRVLACGWAILTAIGCASVGSAATDAGNAGGDGGALADACAGCGQDEDGDGVPDAGDQCPGTPAGAPVNLEGCADSQLSPKRETSFPPYGLTWTETGDFGRVGGVTWDYTGIDRGDLFHIYWIVCDDPQPCGISLNGPVDAPSESWVFDAADSDLAAGTAVFTNRTQIALDDGTAMALNGRMTMRIVDESDASIPFARVTDLGVSARSGAVGAEIPGTGFTVTALAEVQDPATSTWTPYVDYFDAAPTTEMGPSVTAALFGSFYDE